MKTERSIAFSYFASSHLRFFASSLLRFFASSGGFSPFGCAFVVSRLPRLVGMASSSSGSGSGTPNTGCNILVGCVGKPNAGKSSFLNACTDANAKVGM